MHRGVALVLETLNFEEYLAAADLVITGEGKIDSQIQYGKALAGVGALAKRHQVPVVAVAGAVEVDAETLGEFGITAALSCIDKAMSEAEAMSLAAELVQEAAERIMRLILAGDAIARKWQEVK